MTHRRKFSTEFKRGALEWMRRPQTAVIQVAKELGVNTNVLIRSWQELAKPSNAPTDKT